MADTCDVLVIGCGAIGAATAYYLSKAGMKVIAVDREMLLRALHQHVTETYLL